MGKGDRVRPGNKKKYDKNFTNIFGKKGEEYTRCVNCGNFVKLENNYPYKIIYGDCCLMCGAKIKKRSEYV